MLPLRLDGRLIAFETIMHEPLLPVDWLVDSLIPNGSRVVVFGEFGCMKSWLLLDLALHMAAGKSWLGQFPISKAKSVLYIDEEMAERELRRRVKRLGLGAELGGDPLPFRAVSHSGLRFDACAAEQLLRELERQGFVPDIIIVETFRRVLTGSENESTDVSEFWHHVSPFMAAEKTLIISHHMRKPSVQGAGEARHRASGSTDILAGADAGFAVSRLSEDRISVECVKLRADKEPDPFIVGFYDQAGDEQPVAMCFEGAVNAGQAEESTQQQAAQLIKEYFYSAGSGTVKTGDVLTFLEENNIPRRTGERALTTFTTGYADKVKHGHWKLRQPAVPSSSSGVDSANP